MSPLSIESWRDNKDQAERLLRYSKQTALNGDPLAARAPSLALTFQTHPYRSVATMLAESGGHSFQCREVEPRLLLSSGGKSNRGSPVIDLENERAFGDDGAGR